MSIDQFSLVSEHANRPVLFVPDVVEEDRRSILHVFGQTSHQGPNQQPTGNPVRWTRRLESEEQPFVRPVEKLSDRWSPLRLSWLEDVGVGYVEIRNISPRGGPVVEVGFISDGRAFAANVIRPGESCQFEPLDVADVRLRGDLAQVTYVLYPR